MLTRRGEIVLVIGVGLITALALLGLWKVATSIHYTEEGYCWGSFIQCYGEEEGKR